MLNTESCRGRKSDSTSVRLNHSFSACLSVYVFVFVYLSLSLGLSLCLSLPLTDLTLSPRLCLTETLSLSLFLSLSQSVSLGPPEPHFPIRCVYTGSPAPFVSIIHLSISSTVHLPRPSIHPSPTVHLKSTHFQ